MTVSQSLRLATALLLIGFGGLALLRAQSDVTVVAPPSSTEKPAKNTAQTDGTPVVHKSLHKKRKKVIAEQGPTVPAPDASSSSTSAPVASSPKSSVPVTPASAPAVSSSVSAAPKKTPVASTAFAPAAPVLAPAPKPVVSETKYTLSTTTTGPLPPSSSAPAPSTLAPSAPRAIDPVPTGPTVETAMPVSRFPGMNTPIPSGPLVSSSETVPAIKGASLHEPLYASTLPEVVSSAAGTFSLPNRSNSDFTFTNFRKVSNRYPWRTGIITTMFWIGEGGSSISSTDNMASAWDADWRNSNRGSDNPNDRNGFASADHASTVNPFYVALPFNDLAFPEKARVWLPEGWYRPPRDGKQVSACKDRWVWIKNASGRSCFAQWEDVGPLRYDHAEYVFGNDRPDTYTRAGLDVSPAVAEYLGIDENKRAITSWRFVDDEDVPPGAWLKYDEQAVLYRALHELKNFRSSPAPLPLQRTTEPVEDSNLDSNKKQVDATRG